MWGPCEGQQFVAKKVAVIINFDKKSLGAFECRASLGRKKLSRISLVCLLQRQTSFRSPNFALVVVSFTRVENQAKVCDRREHRATLWRESADAFFCFAELVGCCKLW